MNTSRAEANLLNRHRVQLCVLSAAMLLMGACFGGSDATATPTATPTTDAPSPAATASATAEPSTTTPAPTATAVPTAEPMPPGVGEYGVARVRKGDPDGGLNMRAEPSANAEVVLVIPPNRTGLVATGSDPVIVDDATWIELSVGSSSGWVNSTFVTPLPSFEEISCGDPTSDYSLSPGAVPPVPAPVDPDADHVFAMHHIVGPDCERTIITFGRDFGYDDNFNEVLDPSAGVPPDIALAIDLAVIRVRLPESVIAGASTATELYRSDNGSVDVLFVRPAVRSTFGIRALWDRNRGVRYFYLEKPRPVRDRDDRRADRPRPRARPTLRRRGVPIHDDLALSQLGYDRRRSGAADHGVGLRAAFRGDRVDPLTDRARIRRTSRYWHPGDRRMVRQLVRRAVRLLVRGDDEWLARGVGRV